MGGEQRAIKPYIICPPPPFRETLALPPLKKFLIMCNYNYAIYLYAVRVGVIEETHCVTNVTRATSVEHAHATTSLGGQAHPLPVVRRRKQSLICSP